MTGRVPLYGCLVLWLVILALMLAVSRASAQELVYTPDDVVAAIDEYSAEMGVSRTWLYATVKCETGGTFSPYAVGRQGELGAAQLHPRGLLRTFWAWGYSDPFDPYSAIRFMAQEFSFGQARNWTCA